MVQVEAEKVPQGEEPNKFASYQEVIGPQRPKGVLGMGHGVSSVDVFGPPSSQGRQGCSKRCQEDRTKERGKNYDKMKKLEDEIVDVRNAVPHIVESVLQRLRVRLPESFDMDLNSEANGDTTTNSAYYDEAIWSY
ncbi:unnamed protein product [Linum trigynum]|uniref:Uncharacterized protein n=1 Tax=Linum trigynum TaxID=586398 RepID=A0AAV2GK35_9ROSI